MSATLRSLVSGRRHRLVDADLDLSYITPRVLAMSFPSRGVESLYRNPAGTVATYLSSTHGDNALVINLSQRAYDGSPFGDRVVTHMGFPDRHTAPLELALMLCRTMAGWLDADPGHVVVVHCLAGKGRTGMIVACFLLFSGYILQAGGEGPPAPLPDPSTTEEEEEEEDEDAVVAAMLDALEGEGAGDLAGGRVHMVGAGTHTLPGLWGGATPPSPPPPSTILLVPPPEALAAAALARFTAARGTGPAVPSQIRTVGYVARLVFDAVAAAAACGGYDREVDVIGVHPGGPGGVDPACGDAPTTISLSKRGAHPPPPAPTPLTITASALRVLRDFSLPPPPVLRVTRITLSRVPYGEGGAPRGEEVAPPLVRTSLSLSTMPYPGRRGVGTSTQAHPPDGPAGHPAGSPQPVVGEMHATIAGDVLLRCCCVGGGGDETELFRAAFHTGFLSLAGGEGDGGVWRLGKRDLDTPHRAGAARLPEDLWVTLEWERVGEEAEVVALGGGAGAVGGAGDAPPSAATVVVPDRFTRAGLPVDAALVQSVAYFSGGFSA